MKRYLGVLGLVLFSCQLLAQELPMLQSMQPAYKNQTRDVSGKPGKNYWQNKASYILKTDFNPNTRLVKGTEEIVYENHSPDTLKQIWFKLYPNLYTKSAIKKSKIAAADLGDGVSITSLKISGRVYESSNYTIEGTNMYLDVQPLAPGKSLKVSLNYSYTLNKGSHLRTGEVDKGAHFIAYFFPRIAVYDDVDGWNKYPYTGEEEFYNDFCDFTAEISVPKNYMVWATGDLLNGSVVLQPKIYDRLLQAEKSDAVVNVITAEDLEQNLVTSGKSQNVFKFHARNVTDFVFATSNHYLWKSTSLIVDAKSGRRTRVDAAFNPAHKDYYDVIDFAKKSVHAMSYDFPKWPFPYPHITVFDGLDQMEYPMMVNDNPVKNREDAITLTVHEIFHTMFPFYMGINETKYSWMDEGWATIGEWLNGPRIDTNMVDTYGVQQTASSSGKKEDTPIMTFTTDLKGAATFTNPYPKPGMGYLYVWDYLGDDLFHKALHHYIDQWQGKHPIPYDFFYSMNEGSGKNLNWFWKRWFFDDGITDMGITATIKTVAGYQITIQNKSNKPLPIDLNFSFADGSTEKLHRNIGVWEKGDLTIQINLVTDKKLIKIVMGDPHTPDKDKSDNTFTL
ncbi:hypothetical protein ACVWYN_001342 [Pedobacter sp. UYP24]